MSRQTTLDTHLSSGAPRYKPQPTQASRASSSGSSGGERGLRAIQLSNADPVRAVDLTLSERRRMKRRVTDIEDEMSSEGGERVAERRHGNKRRTSGSRPTGRGTADEAVTSIPLTRAEDDSGADEQQDAEYMVVDDVEEPQRQVKPSLGLRPRYSVSKPSTPPIGSHVYLIPQGSEEPIVPLAQAQLARNSVQDAGPFNGDTWSEDEDLEVVLDALVGPATGDDDDPGVGKTVVPDNSLAETLVSKATLATTSATATDVAAGQVANSRPTVARMYPEVPSEKLEASATLPAYESPATAVAAAGRGESRTRPVAVIAPPTSTSPFQRRERLDCVEIVIHPDIDKSKYITMLQVSAKGKKEGWASTKPKAPKPKPARASTRSVSASTQRAGTKPLATLDVEKQVRTTQSTTKATAAVKPHPVVSMSDFEDDDLDWAVEAATSKLLESPVVNEPADADDDEAESDSSSVIEVRPPRKLSMVRSNDSDLQGPLQPSRQAARQSLLRQGGSSRLPAAAKSKLAALAEKKRAQQAAKKPPPRRYLDGFIASDNEEESSAENIQPAIKRKKSKGRDKAPQLFKKERVIYRNSEKLRKRNKATTVHDPDEDTSEAAVSESEDITEELELEEPNRFESMTRLRERKETAFQRSLRKAKNKRLGIEETTTAESEDEHGGRDAPIEISDDDFIEDDGGEFDDSLLPEQFSNDSAQTPEFRFKVVFQYFLLIVIAGPEVLPLRGKEEKYFIPRLVDQRRRMASFKTGLVQSQVWRANFVRAMETFPRLDSYVLDVIYDGCDACHMSGRMSRFEATLSGSRYDENTFEALNDEEESRGSDEESLVSEEELPRTFKLGRMCHARTKVFHQFSHWERNLYCEIRSIYRDLLRAKGRRVPDDSDASDSALVHSDDDEGEIRRRERTRDFKQRQQVQRVALLKKGRIPNDVGDVNEVLIWLEEKGHVSQLFLKHEELVESAQGLEKMRGDRDDR